MKTPPPVASLLFSTLASLAALGTSCAVTEPQVINEKYRDVLDHRHNQYEIKGGDQVNMRIYGVEGLDQTGLVLPDGRSDLFFLHNHRFGGKSILEIEADLRTRLGREVRDPSEIAVQITPGEEVVYLVGEFERPATVPLKTKMTVREAISAVGGMRITGDTDYALLIRPFRDPAHPDRFYIDLNDASEEVFLLPGDQVILGQNFAAAVIAYLREYIFGVVPYRLWGLGGAAGAF